MDTFPCTAGQCVRFTGDIRQLMLEVRIDKIYKVSYAFGSASPESKVLKMRLKSYTATTKPLPLPPNVEPVGSHILSISCENSTVKIVYSSEQGGQVGPQTKFDSITFSPYHSFGMSFSYSLPPGSSMATFEQPDADFPLSRTLIEAIAGVVGFPVICLGNGFFWQDGLRIRVNESLRVILHLPPDSLLDNAKCAKFDENYQYGSFKNSVKTKLPGDWGYIFQLSFPCIEFNARNSDPYDAHHFQIPVVKVLDERERELMSLPVPIRMWMFSGLFFNCDPFRE
jgi:hypothetical protein